jgi:hypothetical protein
MGGPFAATFTLIIIGVCFQAMPALLGGLNYLQEGKRKRDYCMDAWTHRLRQRDLGIQTVYGDRINAKK